MSVVERLQEFLENEARSCSMDFGCITPLYVYRCWGGAVAIEDIVNKSTDCYYLIEKLPSHMLILKGNKMLKKKSKRKKGRNYS